MKIGQRMLIMFGVSLAGIVTLFALSITTIAKVKVNGPIYRNIVQGKDVAADILPPPEYILESYLIVQTAKNATSPDEIQKLFNELKSLKKEFDERHNYWSKELPSGPIKDKLLKDVYDPATAFYAEALNRYFPALISGDTATATTVLQTTLKESYQNHRQQVDALVRLVNEQCKKDESGAAETLQTAQLVIYLAGFAVLCLSALLSFFVSRSITRPVERCVAIADRLATGDLTEEIVVSSNDETGRLMAAMKNMVENLRTLVRSTVDISASIASASNQLHATSDQIATGANEVASQTEVVATASEEMAHTSGDIANSCVLAAETSKSTSVMATTGAAVVQETIQGMARIAERVKQTSAAVNTLGKRSNDIGQIVGTIEDIADQTNLLALNAAIEAARAGEQGRGFAVVADEVRALAERTTKATKEIGEMIKAIQRETNDAVRSMEEGVVEVEKGADSSRKSGEALQKILSQINDVTMQINQIATAAEEQTATTGEITSNIHQVSQVVLGAARGAQETSSSAGVLAQQAQQLQNLVRSFRIA